MLEILNIPTNYYLRDRDQNGLNPWIGYQIKLQLIERLDYYRMQQVRKRVKSQIDLRIFDWPKGKIHSEQVFPTRYKRFHT